MKKEIFLKQLTLLNFKGVRSFTVDFTEKITTIAGENGVGKTTLLDAFTWLLFGKDSTDRSAFEIKTLDENNDPLHKLDHEVTAILQVGGEQIELRRVYREKWVKKRGSATAELEGHTTDFFWNGVPQSQQEYKKKIDSLIDEAMMKLLTSPKAFNALDWQKRRQVLTAMAGNITDNDIAGEREDFRILLSQITGKSLEEYKREIAARKKKLKEQLTLIPARIDEAERGRPEAMDYVAIEKEIETLSAYLVELEQQIADKSSALQGWFDKVAEHRREVGNINLQIQRLEGEDSQKKLNACYEIEQEIKAAKRDIEAHQRDADGIRKEIAVIKGRIVDLDAGVDRLRAEWVVENEKTLTIDPNALKCPTCQREFETEKVEDIREKLSTQFNESKTKLLKQISDEAEGKKSRGNELRAELEKKEAELNTLAGQVKECEDELKACEAALEEKKNAPFIPNPEIEVLRSKLKEVEAAAPEKPTVDDAELKEKKRKTVEALSVEKIKRSTKDQVEKTNTRIKQLQEEERSLAQQIADLESTEFTIEQFTRAKIDEIESRINSRFKIVRFRMFRTLVNEGEVECCDCLVNGVPYPDLNTASKINAGMDIINALSDHYGISAPVWVDNREGVTELLSCDSQIINLMKLSEYKTLTVI
jgi:DNA repair exonuclease SbcCD ATPase subunit